METTGLPIAYPTNNGHLNSGFDNSHNWLNSSDKYLEKKVINSNQISSSREIAEQVNASNNFNRLRKFPSVSSFNCCKSNKIREESTISDLQSARRTSGSCDDIFMRSIEKVFYISGQESTCTIPDVITSHPVSATHSSSDGTASERGQCPSVVHVRQRYKWDCGVTCVMMVLSEKHRQYLNHHLDLICDQEGFKNSTWSIDLAYLLHRFSVAFRYYTITLGVDPGLTTEKFYQTAIYKDAMRVVDRFHYASNHGVSVHKCSVSLASIVSHLQAGLPIIVLTNAQKLHCYDCNNRSSNIRNCFTGTCSTAYQGHFIVLVDHDPDQGLLYYANPSSNDPVCHCSYEHMQEARLSYGTDEDIIFIDSNQLVVPSR